MFDGLRRFISGFKSLKLSYSRLKSYEFCPKLYYLENIEKLKRPKNPAMNFGITLHRVLENFHKKKMYDIDTLIGLYDENFRSYDYNSDDEAGEYRDRGTDILERYLSDNFASGKALPEILSLEKWFDIQFGRHRIRGKIDRIDRENGKIVIMDYKSHRETLPKEELIEDLQMSIYRLAAEKYYGGQNFRFLHYFISSGEKIETERTPDIMKKHTARIAALADSICYGLFAVRTENCPRCDFAGLCDRKSVDSWL